MLGTELQAKGMLGEHPTNSLTSEAAQEALSRGMPGYSKPPGAAEVFTERQWFLGQAMLMGMGAGRGRPVTQTGRQRRWAVGQATA